MVHNRACVGPTGRHIGGVGASGGVVFGDAASVRGVGRRHSRQRQWLRRQQRRDVKEGDDGGDVGDAEGVRRVDPSASRRIGLRGKVRARAWSSTEDGDRAPGRTVGCWEEEGKNGASGESGESGENGEDEEDGEDGKERDFGMKGVRGEGGVG